jgi:hypothetical protein
LSKAGMIGCPSRRCRPAPYLVIQPPHAAVRQGSVRARLQMQRAPFWSVRARLSLVLAGRCSPAVLCQVISG